MRVFTRFLFIVWICQLSKKKYTAYDRFHGNGPYGKIPTKKEPIRTLGFTSRLSCHIINEFYFRVAKQYFTNERSEWVKYCFCHEKIKFISSSRRVMFFLLYRHADDVVFDDFRRFPKISKIVPKARRTFPNIFRKFPKISEDFRWLPKIFEEDPKMFRWYTNEFKYNLRDKQKQKAGIVTSLNDTTLTKVTYGKYATRVLDEVAYGIYEWFSSQ